MIEETKTNVYNLDQEVTKEETGIEGYTVDVDDSIFSTLASATVETKEQPVKAAIEDDVVYSTEHPYILINTKDLFKTLSQISPIVNLNATRAVGRGITLRVVDNSQVEVIHVTDMYYFHANLQCETNFSAGDIVYLDYTFLQKLAKFFPSKTLIYKIKEEGLNFSRHFLRLSTGDLEIRNAMLIDADKKKLDSEFNITTEYQELNPAALNHLLTTFVKLIPLLPKDEGQSKKLNIYNKEVSIDSTGLHASAHLDSEDMVLSLPIMNYILKTLPILKDGESLKIYNTDSTGNIRYAIMTENTYMIALYATATETINSLVLSNKPVPYVEIDYSDFKYKFDYFNSITYSEGNLTLKVKDGKLLGALKLSTGTDADVEIKTLSSIPLPEGTEFSLNMKAIYSVFNALEPLPNTYLGFVDGILYFKNDNITIATTCKAGARFHA